MTETTIYARPNMNGNVPETFTRAARELMEAAQDAKNTLQKDVSECFHGRNYQFQEDSLRKRNADVATVQELHRGLDQLIDFALVLHRASEAPADELPKEDAA